MMPLAPLALLPTTIMAVIAAILFLALVGAYAAERWR